MEDGSGLKILGTCLDLLDPTGTEIENRIACGWRKFWSLSNLLLNRKVSLKRRLKIFDATVGSCVLWCTESWTPRQEELRELSSAQRSMLRKVHGLRRTPEESWVQWLQRSTGHIESIATSVGVRTWTSSHFQKKWQWAGHVARRPENCWLKRTTSWRDSRWQSVVGNLVDRPLRPSKRRWMKWESSVHSYRVSTGGPHWTETALSKDSWNSEAQMFAAWSLM